MKAMIESRVQLINKFIQARNIEKENPDSMVATCEVRMCSVKYVSNICYLAFLLLS